MSRIDTLTPADTVIVAAGQRRAVPGVRETVKALFATLWTWRFRARTRHQLARLDARMLRDIGLDPMTADKEATKPFWQS